MVSGSRQWRWFVISTLQTANSQKGPQPAWPVCPTLSAWGCGSLAEQAGGCRRIRIHFCPAGVEGEVAGWSPGGAEPDLSILLLSKVTRSNIH